MSDMSPDAKSLLDAARDGDEPTGADDARTRRALVAQLGVGLTIAASTTATTSAAAAGAAGAGAGVGGAVVGASSAGVLIAKVIVGIAVVGGIGAGGASLYRSRSPEISAPPAVSVATAAPRSRATAAAPAPQMQIAPAPLTTTPPTRALPATAAAAAAPATATATPMATANTAPSPTVLFPRPVPKPAPPTVSTLDDETRLVRDADAALRGGDAARALTLLDEHARLFPSGVLAEERAAERVLALCALGRTGEARTAAATFLRDRPLSPLATRVRSSCGAP